MFSRCKLIVDAVVAFISETASVWDALVINVFILSNTSIIDSCEMHRVRLTSIDLLSIEFSPYRASIQQEYPRSLVHWQFSREVFDTAG